MSARIHKWLPLYIVALWIIYRDICIYLCIYLSVLLLNSVAFGLLQRVDSQKSMLTWPEVLEMNVPAWWTLSLELVSKWRNDSQLCGMWHVAKWPKGLSKLKTQDWCVSSVIFDKFPKCLNNTLFIIAANELRDESICLSHASIPFFFCSSLLFSSVVVVVYVAYFRRLLFTSNWGWARKQMHCASECVFIVSLWGVQFDQRWRKNFAWFAPHINLFNWHFCHAAERSFIIKSGNVYKLWHSLPPPHVEHDVAMVRKLCGEPQKQFNLIAF